MKKIKIFSFILLLSLIIPSLSLLRADNESKGPEQKGNGQTVRLETKLENKEIRIENRVERASTTEKRLENRENNIERIKEKMASTTASTPPKKIENLDKRFDKQVEQMGKVKERLINKELKIADILGKIADKILERINILAGKGLDMTAARAKLAEASTKLEEMTVEGDKLATLINTEITDTNKAQLFIDIKASQDKIKGLAKATHALLVDTIKEITKVLPKNGKATTTATTTATSTATTTATTTN
jgi:hypothetical protein